MNTKLRFYLSTDNDTHRKFYWFELQGHDLYWGNSADTKIAFCEIKQGKSDSFQVQTPENFKKLNLERIKYSFHESGQFHSKKLIDGAFRGINLKKVWPSKSGINGPFRIFSLITKPLIDYPIERKKLTRENTSGISILLERLQNNYRLFFEIFLSQPGQFQEPIPLINFGSNNQNRIFHKLNLKFTLYFRYTKLKDLHDWFPDTEIIFVTDKKHSAKQKQ